MRSGTDRDAPQPIEPPTGALEVYTYDPKTGRAALHLACGDDTGRAVTARTSRALKRRCVASMAPRAARVAASSSA